MANAPHNTKRPTRASVVEAIAENDIQRVIKKLTVLQRAFCNEYVVDHRGDLAAARAGYSLKNAKQQAYLLLMNEGVQAYIAHLKQSTASKIMTIDPDYVIAGITRILSKDDAKDSDKLRGFELLARHLGMFIERTELTGADGGALEINQRAIAEEADVFTAQLRQLQERKDAERKLDS